MLSNEELREAISDTALMIQKQNESARNRSYMPQDSGLAGHLQALLAEQIRRATTKEIVAA